MQILTHLSTVDGLVILAYLLGVVALGAVFRKQSNTTEFLLANRGMGWLPVGLSVMASLFSANSFVMIPGEAYRYSLLIGVSLIAMFLTAPIVMRWFIPFYVRSGCFTAYELLEKRFDVRVRVLAVILFIFLRLGWMAAATFSCSLAISVISGTDLYLTICVLGAIATLYTVCGGLKAGMWTDVAQFVVFGGAIVGAAVVAIGEVPGGWAGAIGEYEEAGKLKFTDFRLDLSLRMGTWALLLGQFTEMLSAYTSDQLLVQRYLAAKSVKECRRAFIANLGGATLILPGLLLVGVALCAFYQAHPGRLSDAPAEYFARKPEALQNLPDVVETLARQNDVSVDEWTNRVADDSGQLKEQLQRFYEQHPQRAEADLFQVNRQDEVMPFFVRRELPAGLIGLVLAALFAATMSSIDSGIHSIATTVVIDIRNRLFRTGVDPDARGEMRFVRGLTLVLGVVATVISCLVDRLGPVFDMTKKLNGAFSGSLLAVFVLAVFSSRAKATPVLVAAIVGTTLTLWLTYTTSIFPLWFCVFGFVTTWVVASAGSALSRDPRES